MTSKCRYIYGFGMPQDFSLAVGSASMPRTFILSAPKQGVEETGQQIFFPHTGHAERALVKTSPDSFCPAFTFAGTSSYTGQTSCM